MRLRTAIRTHIISRLPPQWRFPIERFYDYYCAKDYVKSDVDLIKKLCYQDKASIDIGANKGQLTLFLLRYSSHVYCFEPVPILNEYLRQRFHKCNNITIEECAIGNINGELTLRIPVIGSEKILTRSSLIKDFNQDKIFGERISKIEQILVPVKKLDDLNLDNIGFIKIDVEGFESQVLEGGWSTIHKCRPNMLIEIEQRHCIGSNMNDIIQNILQIGYHGYFMYNNKLCDIKKFNLQKMQNPFYENSKHYVNNFAFSHAPLL